MNPNRLTIHAIILALNEEIFIKAQLDTIYQFCDRISIITQYDRDWYGTKLMPDNTINAVVNYPDPEGKIHFIIRRLPDEASARNMEMLSFNNQSWKNTISHGRSIHDISSFHKAPDYFWIIDADEIYDVETIPAILDYLEQKHPRGMRVTGYNYLRTWNRRVPRSVIDFTHFGFVRAGILFEQRRVINWNEFRISKLFQLLRLPDWSGKLFGFTNCPESVGIFHHGCWLGDDTRIVSKFSKSSHQESKDWKANSVDKITSIHISKSDLPINIQLALWPNYFFEDK